MQTEPSTVYVNQQINTSQWFGLGTYSFLGGVQYRVTIVASPAPASTCADAVRFVRVDDPSLQPPVADFSVRQNHGSGSAHHSIL